jgi:hypothetical protein
MFFMFAVQFVPGLMWHVPGDLSMPHFNYHCNFKLRTCGNREVDGQDTLYAAYLPPNTVADGRLYLLLKKKLLYCAILM